MKRTKFKTPDLIITSDWHIRETPPSCRVDDFWDTQWNKIRFIKSLQEKYNCPIYHAGDLFDYWKPSPFLLAKTIKELPDQFYTIYGNHDLPQHNLDLTNKTGIHVLENAGKLKILDGTHWGLTPSKLLDFKNRKLYIWHTTTYKGRPPWPQCTDPNAKTILKTYPEADLIITGHIHQPFTEENNGSILINPGSITRQESDQKNVPVSVFLYYADTNSFEQIKIPTDINAVTESVIRKNIKERDARIEAFISKISNDWDVSLDFEENLERFFKENNTKDDIKKIIYEMI